MDYLNQAFLEEYKRLDKLCRDVYLSDKGVTSYIENMRQVSEFERRSIPSWDSDLRHLMTLRHIRNQLTHDVGTLHADMCTVNDIAWLKDFYSRILNVTDPLSLLRKEKSHFKEQMRPVSDYQLGYDTRESPGPQENSAGCLGTALLCIACSLLITLGIMCYIL